MKKLELVARTRVDKTRFRPRWNRFTAAKNRLASSLDNKPGVLYRLARRLNLDVQQRVAENRTTNSETLELLAIHASSDIRSAVAQNDNSLRSTVDSLADDANCDVRYAMAENPWTSTLLLERLSEDENPHVQNRAKRTQARLLAEETLLADQGGGFDTEILPHRQTVSSTLRINDLAELPKQTQLLVAHFLEANENNLTLLKSDTDVGELVSRGWLTSVRLSTIGVSGFTFKPSLWRQLRALQQTFLTDQLLHELKIYRHNKTALYPWVWDSNH